ncbi:hypothetical protein N0V85_009503 [Neurospora sp. IMI 360204]|nr:hypothetical protein N0V85_009503 [Neurospora sp. IMI 360204]
MHLHEFQPKILLDTFVEPAEVGLVADAGCILEELDVCDTRETDLMVRPEGVRVIASVGILKDGFEGISAYAGSGESRVAEGLDIDNACCLRVNNRLMTILRRHMQRCPFIPALRICVNFASIEKQLNKGPGKDKKCFKCNKPGHFARDCRSGDNNNRRQGGWKPVPTHSTNSVSKGKGKGKEVDNIEIDHDFANALAALVDDEAPRTVCMVDYNEPTDQMDRSEQLQQELDRLDHFVDTERTKITELKVQQLANNQQQRHVHREDRQRYEDTFLDSTKKPEELIAFTPGNLDNFDSDQFEPLFNAVLTNKPDDEIWRQVYCAVTEATPPPRSTASYLLQTPRSINTSSKMVASMVKRDRLWRQPSVR